MQVAHKWPSFIPRVFRPVATLKNSQKLRPYQALDLAAMEAAAERERNAIQCSAYTGTWTEAMFTNRADYTALASFTSEASLLAGGGSVQPVLQAFFFDSTKVGRAARLLCRGVLGTTGTPTYTFQVRLGTTSGSAFLSGTSVGVSVAITTASGVTAQLWELVLDLTCTSPGIGSGNTTLSCAGYVMSGGGFASPFWYALEPTTPPTATWTATVDSSVNQYFNVSVTSSASSASNTLTVKQLQLHGLN